MNARPAPSRLAGSERLWPVGLLSVHPETDRVPPMTQREYQALRADIATRPIVVPIEITQAGLVLDGRARLQAAIELGHTEIPARVVAVEDEVEHILKAATLRRDLTQSQKAALAVERHEYQAAREAAVGRQRANLRLGPEVATLPPPEGKTRDLAADWAGVSARTVQDAATVRDHDPNLFQQIKDGAVPASVAARRVRRQIRDATIAPVPPIPEGPFELVYADPPWQLGNPDSPSAPENHYPTMPLGEIAALAVPAADHAVLFLWAVNCLLPEALHVMAAWGFTYRANLVWDKVVPGQGNWVRNQHELLLIGRKGRHPAPDKPDVPASVLTHRKGAHSAKPHAVYELLERMYPCASKVELFARGTPRPGWAAWGNQTTG